VIQQSRQCLARPGPDDDVRGVIARGRREIDDRETRARRLRVRRQVRRGVDDQRGADHDEEIGRARRRPASAHAMGGIASPKIIVCGFTTPPQAGHSGTATPSSSHAWTSSRLNAAPHARHRARVALPWISITASSGRPARWCRLSTFWVMQQSSRPSVHKVAMATCAAFGLASRITG